MTRSTQSKRKATSAASENDEVKANKSRRFVKTENIMVDKALKVTAKAKRTKQTKETKPKEVETGDYASKDYWNNRYCIPCDNIPQLKNNTSTSKDAEKDILSHEWYYSFDDLSPLLLKQDIFHHRKNETSTMKVLEVGCGNKPLLPSFITFLKEADSTAGSYFQPEQLYGIDFSDQVIHQLRKDAVDENQLIHYECMDARNLYYPAQSFDLILDKGTMDAMLSEKSKKKGLTNAQQMINEMVRCITVNYGLILIVSHISADSEDFSLLFEEIFMPALMTQKQSVIWKLEIHGASSSEAGKDSNVSYGTVYCLTCKERRETRSKGALPNEVFMEFFEYNNDEEEDDDEEEDNGDEEG